MQCHTLSMLTFDARAVLCNGSTYMARLHYNCNNVTVSQRHCNYSDIALDASACLRFDAAALHSTQDTACFADACGYNVGHCPCCDTTAGKLEQTQSATHFECPSAFSLFLYFSCALKSTSSSSSRYSSVGNRNSNASLTSPDTTASAAAGASLPSRKPSIVRSAAA